MYSVKDGCSWRVIQLLYLYTCVLDVHFTDYQGYDSSLSGLMILKTMDVHISVPGGTTHPPPTFPTFIQYYFYLFQLHLVETYRHPSSVKLLVLHLFQHPVGVSTPWTPLIVIIIIDDSSHFPRDQNLRLVHVTLRSRQLMVRWFELGFDTRSQMVRQSSTIHR